MILSFTAGLGDLLALNHTVSKDQFLYVFYGCSPTILKCEIKCGNCIVKVGGPRSGVG